MWRQNTNYAYRENTLFSTVKTPYFITTSSIGTSGLYPAILISSTQRKLKPSFALPTCTPYPARVSNARLPIGMACRWLLPVKHCQHFALAFDLSRQSYIRLLVQWERFIYSFGTARVKRGQRPDQPLVCYGQKESPVWEVHRAGGLNEKFPFCQPTRSYLLPIQIPSDDMAILMVCTNTKTNAAIIFLILFSTITETVLQILIKYSKVFTKG